MGHGVESVSNYTLSQWYRYATHNCFLDILGDCGFWGLVLHAILLVFAIRKNRSKKNGVVFACAVLVPLAFINGYYTMHFWIIYALIYLFNTYYGELSGDGKNGS